MAPVIDKTQRPRRLELLVACTFAATIGAAAGYFPGVRYATPLPGRSDATVNWQEIEYRLDAVYRAILNYEDKHKGMPTLTKLDEGGRPINSWRLMILHEMEAWNTPRDFDEPWFSDANSSIRRCAPTWYCFNDILGNSPTDVETNVVAVDSEGSVFGPNNRASELQKKQILFLGVPHSGVHWMEPFDVNIGDFQQGDRLIGELSPSVPWEWVYFVYADGSMERVSGAASIASALRQSSPP